MKEKINQHKQVPSDFDFDVVMFVLLLLFVDCGGLFLGLPLFVVVVGSFLVVSLALVQDNLHHR